MAIPDPITLVRTYLLTVSAVTNLTSTRIYGESIPAADAASMPRACVVLSPAGGPATEWLRTVESRIDVRCYGATPLAARTLAWAVYDALAWLPKRTIGSGLTAGKLYKAEPELAPLSQIDPDTNWPSAVFSLLVTTSREPTA